MLTRDVRLEGFDTEDWVRLATAIRPGPSRRGERLEQIAAHQATSSGTPRGGVIAVSTGARLRKLLSTRSGRLAIADERWPDSLAALAERHGARWAIELHTGALEELMDRFGERLRPEQDLMGQAVLLLSVLRELEMEGVVSAWPWRLNQWPALSERVLVRAFDALCPDGKVILVGIFDQGELSTCLAARRHDTGFDYLLGPEDLRGRMGLISGDWTRDYRHLVSAVEDQLGQLAVGCFGEYETFQRLAASEGPGVWAQAVAGRDIILSPIAPALALPLGIDVGRAAVATIRDLAEWIGARSWVGPDSPLLPALDRIERLPVFDRDLRAILGFDPFALLRKLLAGDAGRS